MEQKVVFSFKLQLHFQMVKKNGFSLIELLVAITIIAILSAIGLTAYQSIYKTSRDAQRKSDIKLIQSALEQYVGDQQNYPLTLTFGSPLISGSKVYLNKVPSSPTTPNYSYQATGVGCASGAEKNCTSYCLYAKLEDLAGSVSDATCTSYPAGGYNFGVTRP